MADDDFHFRRVRSISVSLESNQERNGPIEPILNSASVPAWYPPLNTAAARSLTLNSRTVSSVFLAKEHRGLGSKFNDFVNFMKLKCFAPSPFRLQCLPDAVKVHVFSFLGQKNLARLMVVCKEWNVLMRCQTLWSRVDFCEMRLCGHVTATQKCLSTCYPGYKARVKSYADFINRIKPSIKFLRFSFDIGDYEDGWKAMLMSLMVAGRMKELKWAEINWKETSERRLILNNNLSATWSDSELRNFSINRKFRQRIFLHFFDVFTAITPNLQHLRLPFDWFDNNIQAFSRLSNLRSLQLNLYFAYFNVSQEKLSFLLSLLPSLQELSLEFWQESGVGYSHYHLHHANLTVLDISMCKGVYITNMSLPNLKIFRTSRSPRRWTLPCEEVSRHDLPCLHRVLADGAPSLSMLNEHSLEERWLWQDYAGLEMVLGDVCPCLKHCRVDVGGGDEGGGVEMVVGLDEG